MSIIVLCDYYKPSKSIALIYSVCITLQWDRRPVFDA